MSNYQIPIEKCLTSWVIYPSVQDGMCSPNSCQTDGWGRGRETISVKPIKDNSCMSCIVIRANMRVMAANSHPAARQYCCVTGEGIAHCRWAVVGDRCKQLDCTFSKITWWDSHQHGQTHNVMASGLNKQAVIPYHYSSECSWGSCNALIDQELRISIPNNFWTLTKL